MDTSHGRRRWLGWIAACTVGLSVAIGMLPALRGYVDQWSSSSAHVLAKWLIVAFAVSMVVRPLSALGWQFVLRAFGHRMPLRTSGRIWMVAESCRWLPGGVWHFCSRAVQCNGHGVPLAAALASMALELVLTIAASLALALVAVVVYGRQEILADRWLSWHNIAVGSAVAVTAAVAGLCVYFLLRRRFPRKFEAIAERFASLRRIHPRPLPAAVCFLFYVALMALNGVAFYATLRSVSPDAAIPWLAAVAANSVAWVVGLVAVAVMVPAGLGVREGILVLQMSVWMRVGDAVLVAILWRGLLLGVELFWVAIAGAAPLVARLFLFANAARRSNSSYQEAGE